MDADGGRGRRLLQFALDDLKRILILKSYPMGTVKYHMNDVIEKHRNKPKDPVQTVKKKEVLRELVKTTILEQDPPNHKIVGGVCLHPPCLTSKDGVFVAWPPL